VKTVKVSSVHYEMAKEKMKKRKIRTIEDYIGILIRGDYSQGRIKEKRDAEIR
tara:strand:+ start:1076 stop:1234 length:159 start_codon:yes stop_codon:yes gene_type:complete